jgi:hypothetical protein
MFGIDDAILGGVISGGLGLLGSSMTNDANARASAEANALSQRQFETRYQTTVKDMQAAGLNPMLAYSQGGGSPPTAQAPPPKHDVVSSAVGGFRGQMEREILRQQALNLAKEGDLTQEKIATQKELTEATRMQAGKDSSQSMLADSQYALNVQAEAKERANRPHWEENFKAQAEKLHQDVQEAIQRIKTGQASAAQYNALVKQIQQKIRLSGYSEQRLKNMSEAEKSEVKQKVTPYLNELRLLMEALRGAGSTTNINNYED